MAQEAETPAEAPEAEAPESTEGQEPTPTGKTYDEAVVKDLRSENAARRKRIQELEAKVSEFESAGQSEIEKLTGKVTKAEQAQAAAEAKLIRYEVAAEKQLPSDVLDLLEGTTREELEARADRLLELAKNRTETPETPDFDGGAREPSPEPKTPEQQINDISLGILGLTPNSQYTSPGP